MYDRFPLNSIVVQKYGGTSVGTVERIQAVAARTARHFAMGRHRIAVVVSAMSGETNRLLDLVKRTNPSASARSADLTAAAGEQVSVGLVCAALEASGVKPEPLLAGQLGIRTDEKFARARIVSINPTRIETAWAQGKVPVVAGFQGVTPSMDITTLGRGGSDTSAVALAAALGAAFCEINTDVDGVFTADPRIVPRARLIETLSADVALELAALGSKVLHSRCVELASKYRMPLVVRNTFLPDESRRTFIMPDSQSPALESPAVSGITLDRDIAKFTVEGCPGDTQGLARLFSRVAEEGANVDIIVHDIKSGESLLGFSVPDSDAPAAARGVEAYRRIVGGDVRYEITEGLSKVSAVGLGMRSHSGVAAKMFEVLAETQTEVIMISTSEIKISCVVPSQQAELAVRALHDAFFPAEVSQHKQEVSS